ncbi:MAG: aminotransferase class III-fold pyridoxal phosphate-dependent enzyme [Candidatus Solibacter usitatus]|nr:aminotransferase class III-fold pyridoxal phosphate-dependent enzyme [Candidatus Solibacter usitatus]
MAAIVSPTQRELDLEHVWHGNLQHQGLEKRPPLEIVRAEGCWVYDSGGRRYLDAMAGLWCVNVGYGRREIVEAVAAQMAQLPYYPLTQSHPPGAQLAARLAELLPKGLSRVFFLNSGSEAVETALKMARQYGRRAHPGQNRYKIIARYRAYHGFTMGALSATGQAARKRAFEPLVPGFLHVAPPDPYRCTFCSPEPGCTLACADEFDRVIRMEGPETVAAVILEPSIGGGGVFHAPSGYLERVREICDRHGVLMIADEVITGFGRTGKMFAFEHAGIRPDILTVAKGITSAYLPLAATIATDEVFDAFRGETDDVKFAQVSTFGGHPCSCAAGLANLEILTRERLWENSARMGEYLADRLRELKSPAIGEVRGRGLLIGLEMVADSNRAPLPEPDVIRMQRLIREAGVLVGRNNDTVPGFGNVLTLAPPLTLSREEADAIVAGIETGLRQL